MEVEIARDSRLKILQLTPYYPPSVGGMQFYVQNLSEELATLGHEIVVATSGDGWGVEQPYEGSGVKVERYAPDVAIFRAQLSRRLLVALPKRTCASDVIHIHIPFHFGLEAAVLSGLNCSVPVVATHHGEGDTESRLHNLLASAYGAFYRRASLRGVSRLVFLTESYRDHMRLQGDLPSRTRVVRTGSDITRFGPFVSGDRVREKLGTPSDEKLILFVGSLRKGNEYKGLNVLLDAFKLVLGRKAAAKVVIVGGGELRSMYQRQASVLGIEDSVRFVGTVENKDLPQFYAACEMLVLPSIRGPENSPVVVSEAMASAKPAIVSDLPGVRDLLSDGNTGLLVHPGDALSLANAIDGLLEDPSRARRMGLNARRKAESNTWKDCAERMVSVYRSAIKDKSGDRNPRRLLPRSR